MTLSMAIVSELEMTVKELSRIAMVPWTIAEETEMGLEREQWKELWKEQWEGLWKEFEEELEKRLWKRLEKVP